MYRVPKEDAAAVEIEAQCCQRTQGRRVSLAEMARVSRSGEKLFLIVQAKRHQEFRKLAAR